jgi:Lrp/AsnC family leucine-responsive transcriptional regulator
MVLLDSIDYQIIACLQQNSRMQWKEIGKLVHLTGQAVAERVRRLEEAGIIQTYTMTVNLPNNETNLTAFITVLMKTPSSHSSIQALLTRHQHLIQEAHRISGDGCYWLKVSTPSLEVLNTLCKRLFHLPITA